MSGGKRRCVGCGAELDRDQDFCLECGAAQVPSAAPQWRRPLVAAAVTLVIAALVLAFAYLRIRDDANDAAASHAAAGNAVKPAGASAGAAASDSRKPARPAHLAQRSSP